VNKRLLLWNQRREATNFTRRRSRYSRKLIGSARIPGENGVYISTPTLATPLKRVWHLRQMDNHTTVVYKLRCSSLTSGGFRGRENRAVPPCLGTRRQKCKKFNMCKTVSDKKTGISAFKHHNLPLLFKLPEPPLLLTRTSAKNEQSK